LAEDTILADDLLRQLMSVGEVDLLVGILSPGNAIATSHAFHAIEQSFQQHFTRQRAVIVNVCGADNDGGDASRSGLGDMAEMNAPHPQVTSHSPPSDWRTFPFRLLQDWLCARF